MANRRRKGAVGLICAGALCIAGLVPAHAQLPVEPTPSVKTLPSEYPNDWVFLVDPNFFGMESGKVVIADVGAEVDHHKGAIGLAQFGFFGESKSRSELYVVETFYERGHRGARTDVISIYDKATLNPVGEIVLPGGKRAQVLTEQGAFQLTADERFAYVYNFTPAASVTVVDLVQRKVVGEIDIPGCVHAFALGGGGFASLCGNGAVASTRLDENGKFIAQEMSEPFQDIDADPMFTRPAIVGDVAYFPTYGGNIQPINFGGDVAVPGEPWAIEAPAAKTGKILGVIKRKDDSSTWLPSGWQLMSRDDAGRLYVLMRKDAVYDDHDTGGDEVWVIDPQTRAVERRIKLRADSPIIEVTKGDDPYLIAFRPDMSFDVYKANSGDWVRRIGGQIVLVPFAAVAAK